MGQTAQLMREGTDRRVSSRLVLGRPGTIRLDSGETIQVVVTDLARDGCRIETGAALMPDTALSIGIAHIGHTRARVVWRDADGYGCEFDVALSPGDVTAASGPSNVARFPQEITPRRDAPAAKWSPRARLAFITAAALVSWIGVAFSIVWLT